MPIYEYRCAACRATWEALQPRHDSPAPDCPACGAAQAERQLSVFSVASAPQGARQSPQAGPCGSTDCACRTSFS